MLSFEPTEFAMQVYCVVKKIPKGKVSTYQKVAEILGSPGAARAVGNALNKNPFLHQVPCHRVVRTNGEVGGFVGGTDKKIKLLEKEGVKIRGGKILNLKHFNFLFK